MKSFPERPTRQKLRTFIPQLDEVRRIKAKAYQGRLGEIGATPKSRYRLVAVSALVSLLALVGSSLLGSFWAALVGIIAVALIAGGWPAATGVAELRGVNRILSHSTIILLSGLSAVIFTNYGIGASRLITLPSIAAVGIVASFMVELGRGEGAIGRLESTISCVTGVLASVSVAGWVGLAYLYEMSQDSSAVLLAGFVIALILAAFGARMISAGPQEGPRRGAITLGVTPVSFVGVIGYVGATFLTIVIG